MYFIPCKIRVCLGLLLLSAVIVFAAKCTLNQKLLEFAEYGNTVNLQGALRWGANPNTIRTGRGFDNISTVKAKFGLGDLVACDYTFSRSALMLAIESNHLEAVQTLLRAGARIKYVDELNKTPLHIALEQKTGISIVKELLDIGSDMSLRDKEGWDALTTASLAEYPDAVELLLRRGARPNGRSILGFTPLSIIAGKDSPATRQIMNILLKYGADPNIQNAKHETAIDQAAKMKCRENVIFLVQHGAKK